MKTVTTDFAIEHFSRLLDEVGSGEEIVIADDGRPIARIIPVGEGDRGRLVDEADAPSEEVEQAFHGD